MKSLTIFNYKLATILVKKGYKMITSKPNYKVPGHFVYYFDDIPEIKQIIEKFYEEKKK